MLMGVKNNLSTAGAIALVIGAIVALVAAVVYGIVTVAKWAWSG